MAFAKRFFFLLLIFTFSFTFAQPELDVKPDKVEFEDIFNRLDFTYLINKGDAPLTIDSLNFNTEFYLIDFDNNTQPPFTIAPDDSVKMNVTLAGFQFVTLGDTTDTLYIYNNGINNPGFLKIKIDFYEDEYGSVYGNVNDGTNPLENSFVYFFYEGVYLIDTAITNQSGNYNILLPSGNYTAAVEKHGYHVKFFDNTLDPFFAQVVEVPENDSVMMNFTMDGISDTTLSVSGTVFDSTNITPINKGIVIIRKGTHVPPNAPQKLNGFGDVFAGLIKPDGSYKVFTELPDYYYVHAYTNYFLPGYYNAEGLASVYWRDGDTLLIDHSIVEKNINLKRDSSFGGGTISGNILFTNSNPGVDYEGITLLIRSIETNAFYSYNFGKETGTYKVSNIPFGTYEVFAQKIGFDNGLSQIVTIDPVNNQFTNIDVSFIVSGVESTGNEIIPQDVILHPNYPNPFNPSTNISFTLPADFDVKLNVVNILGETVKELLNTRLSKGNYNFNFVAEGLPSGVYIISLQAGNILKTQKIVLLK